MSGVGLILIFCAGFSVGVDTSTPPTIDTTPRVAITYCDNKNITLRVDAPPTAKNVNSILYVEGHGNNSNCKIDIVNGSSEHVIGYTKCGGTPPVAGTPLKLNMVLDHSTKVCDAYMHIFHLHCYAAKSKIQWNVTNSKLNVSANSVVPINVTASVIIPEPSLTITDETGTVLQQVVVIGRKLALHIKADMGRPMSIDKAGCTATALGVTSPVKLTSDNGWCAADDLMADFFGFEWSGDDNSLTANFTAFRLVGQTSNDITFECSVLTCDSEETCGLNATSSCATSTSRRRRAVPIEPTPSTRPHKVSASLLVAPFLQEQATAGQNSIQGSPKLWGLLLMLLGINYVY